VVREWGRAGSGRAVRPLLPAASAVTPCGWHPHASPWEGQVWVRTSENTSSTRLGE
jgi:hypothetical protein